MKRMLKILLVIDMFFIVAAGMLAPIYALYVENIGGNILDVGLSWALFLIFAGVLTLIMGKVESKRSYVKFALFGFGLRTAATVGYLFIASPIHLFLVQIMMGISSAITAPAYDALYSKSLDKGKEAFGWGLWEGFDKIFSGIAAFTGAAVVAFFGFTILFSVMIGVSIFGLILFIFLLQHPKVKKKWK